MGQLNHGNYYQVLGVADTATEEAIKAAYRKMVLRHHPDKSTSAEAVAVFTRIQKAYEVLSHPALRLEYDRQLALNKEVADHYISATARYTSRLISMHVSARQVKAGEPFTVLFRCPRRIEGFKLRGLEHFEILQSVEHEMPYQGSIVTQVHYVLRALEEGTHRLGPATGIAGNMEYVSGEVEVRVAGSYISRTWARRNWFGKYYPAVLISVALLLPAIVFYNIAVYGIRQPGTAGANEERFYPFGQPDKRLETGAMPYQSPTVGGERGSGQVVVANRQKHDAVVLLIDGQGTIIRNHYVRAGDSYTVAKVPPGTYHWAILTGTDWDAKLPSEVEGYWGNFKNGTTIGNEQAGLPLWRIWEKETDETVFYSIYKVTLTGKKGAEALSIETDTGFYIVN